jgi:hypothetical protein
MCGRVGMEKGDASKKATRTNLEFGDKNVRDATDNRDGIKDVPAVSKIILQVK